MAAQTIANISTNYIHNFITSLAFTVVVETLLLFLLLRLIFKDKTGTKKVIFAGAFASFSTIPYVWFVFPYIFSWSLSTSLYYSEPFAFIVEAIFYRTFLKTRWGASLIISLTCNLASYLLGPLLRAQGIWIYW